MLKLFLCLFCFIFTANLSSQNTLETHSYSYCLEQGIQCSSEYEDILKTLQKHPRVNQLIEKVLQDGPLSISTNKYFSNNFEGYWSLEDRTVYLTKVKNTAKNELLITLLFELHNASRSADFQKLDALASEGQISRKKYIEAVEYIEYENALATSFILKEGVSMGLFPSQCRWDLPKTFQSHLSTQKELGHCEWIGEIYDYLRNI